MQSEIAQRENALHVLFAHAQALQNDDQIDVRVRAGFVSFLCVRVYAHVETSVRTILLDYVRLAASDEALVKYVNSQLRRLPNLKYSQLISLLGSFNRGWTDVGKNGSTPKMRDSLDALVGIRNRVAHGDDVFISLEDLRVYFQSTQEIVNLVLVACTAKSS